MIPKSVRSTLFEGRHPNAPYALRHPIKLEKTRGQNGKAA